MMEQILVWQNNLLFWRKVKHFMKQKLHKLAFLNVI